MLSWPEDATVRVPPAVGTLTVASSGHDSMLEDDDDSVLENHQEILETEEEVLDDDDCLENPPD
jgi:hypothetical protein